MIKAKILKEATLTIPAGQTVKLTKKQFDLAKKRGLVEEVKKKEEK